MKLNPNSPRLQSLSSMCYFVSISATEEIPITTVSPPNLITGCAPDFTLGRTSRAFTYSEITTGVDLTGIPLGKTRKFSIYGVKHPSGTCPVAAIQKDASEAIKTLFAIDKEVPYVYLMGTSTADVTDTMEVPITSQFVESTTPDLISSCKNIWRATTPTKAPAQRAFFTAIWTGTKLIVWGGEISPSLNTGGQYDPVTDSWTPTTSVDAISIDFPKVGGHGVWTGNKMVVWGGTLGLGMGSVNTGGAYDPSTDSWAAMTTTNAPPGAVYSHYVWTGSKMIVWGGLVPGNGTTNTGGLYNPTTDSWTSTTTTNAPPKSYNPPNAVWTGSTGNNLTENRMIVWGGNDSFAVNSGGLYNPETNSWTTTTTTNAPAPRYAQPNIWTGSKMIVWGGEDNSTGPWYNNGALYNPATDSWSTMTSTNAPGKRSSHTAIWTGSRMLVWGGQNGASSYINDGALYDPIANTWSAIAATNAPSVRITFPCGVWTGSKMIVWGGKDSNRAYINTGGIYVPF